MKWRGALRPRFSNQTKKGNVWLWLDEPSRYCFCDCLMPVVGVEFGQQVAEVKVNGPFANAQILGDLARTEALGGQLQTFAFAWT